MALVFLRAIDQMNDVIDLGVDSWAKQLRLRAVLQVVGQFFEEVGNGAPQPLDMLELIGARTGAAGVTDLLLPRHRLEHVARKLATSAPQVDLEGQSVTTRLPFDHPL